jgi:TolB-like protein
MGIGIEEAMITDLKKIAGLYMVERTQVKKLMEEMALGQSGMVDESSAPKVGKMLSAGVVLMGSYQTVGDEIKITARMIVAESGEVHLATDVKGKKDNVLQLEEDLALKIIEALHINISTYEQRKIVNKDPLALKTLQEKMTSEASENAMDEALKKIRATQKSYTGKVLLGTSIASTVLTGVFGAIFYSDYNNYMNEKNPAQVVRKGDKAESSFTTALISGGVTGAVLCGTAGYYAVKKWFRHGPPAAVAMAGDGKKTAGKR